MTPEIILGGFILIGLTLYALLGAADFGAGVWEFNTALRASKKERDLIYGAIGPVWEANHVWLIFVIVALFGGFPTAFATMCRVLWVPLLLASIGILFRGVGYAFRSYAAGAVRQQKIWGVVFAVASTAAPFFLGASAWAIASGQLSIDENQQFTGDYLTDWINPMSIFGAFFAVGVCAYLSSVYLTREAYRLQDPDLYRIWRRRAVATGIWMGILSVSGLGLVFSDNPDLWAGFKERAWPMILGSVIAGFISLIALFLNRIHVATITAALTVATVIWGWGLAQFPAIIPPNITMLSSKAPDSALVAMNWTIGLGSLLLVPSLFFLLYLFKGKRPSP